MTKAAKETLYPDEAASAGISTVPEITYVGPKARAYLWIGDSHGCFMTLEVAGMRKLQRLLDDNLGPLGQRGRHPAQPVSAPLVGEVL